MFPSENLNSSLLGMRSAPRSVSLTARIWPALTALWIELTLIRSASAASVGVTNVETGVVSCIRDLDAATRCKCSSKPRPELRSAERSSRSSRASTAFRMRRSSAVTCCRCSSPFTRPTVSMPSPSSKSRSLRSALRYVSSGSLPGSVTRPHLPSATCCKRHRTAADHKSRRGCLTLTRRAPHAQRPRRCARRRASSWNVWAGGAARRARGWRRRDSRVTSRWR